MYTIIEKVAPTEDFLRLREITGLTPRTRKAAEKGLPNSLYGIHIKRQSETIAMGRVVGDGALNFEIVDVAVDPRFQGAGLGRQVMEHIMSYLDREALPSAYITLMADVPELYKKFGFELSRPNTEGMHLIK
ncbi:GNAT family N-acetyltransferase [Microbulbifer sp. A4B17]|uniref:GNAT family N-acetyltransferase n=1 Tax=Microbulbifer sp. A4B17 TaxID=359370 RepID=UPI000D52BBD5|nr:GNAT family N-acetyltransferase [Microbulbifer sp. A4B17]AWF80398.1 GNAT family N-acetyltransferase [Microbulbifer sp. A4B17]